ncbi:MAG: hypothetical protein PGN25_10800 [Methylorubrum populi]
MNRRSRTGLRPPVMLAGRLDAPLWQVMGNSAHQDGHGAPVQAAEFDRALDPLRPALFGLALILELARGGSSARPGRAGLGSGGAGSSTGKAASIRSVLDRFALALANDRARLGWTGGSAGRGGGRLDQSGRS